MSHAPRSLVIGHRGASGYRPEHSRAAYELAFALGADFVEPDIVATRDGVLVLRHENEISGTTDVARHPEFASRRTTKRIDGAALTGWFTEDFTWDELATLRTIERLPKVRPASTAFDGLQPILRLSDLMSIIDEASERQGRRFGMVAEIKHASYFASIGLPLDELFAAEIAGWADQERLIIESFEETVLHQLRAREVPGRIVYLVQRKGTPADQLAALGDRALPYSAHLTPEGLGALSTRVDGVSVEKALIVEAAGNRMVTTDLVERIHAAGLLAFTWTLRPESRFLVPPLRRGKGKAEHGDWMTEFRAIFATGIDGVFADHPDLAVAARDGL